MAIAYSTVLIVVMFAAIALFQLLVGKRQLGRRLDQSRTNWAAGG
jgi:iron(III) transport system permease protein